jgi:hypothetical protein
MFGRRLCVLVLGIIVPVAVSGEEAGAMKVYSNTYWPSLESGTAFNW